MSVKKPKGLGRGLDALLGNVSSSRPGPSASESARTTDGELKDLPLDLIQRGKYQPRIDMHPEALEDLANSIKAQGVVQPIVVRPIGSGRYEIIAGERRWRASQIAGSSTIPAIIRDVPDEAAVAMALIENIQREELSPIEESMALQRLIDEFQMTHMQAAEAVGRSRVAVTNLLRLLTLTDEVKAMLSRGELEMGHARALLALAGNAQVSAAKIVISKGMSVRETEKLVRKLLNKDQSAEQVVEKPDPNIIRLQNDLSDKLGARVAIHHSNKGKGKLEINYNSLDELDGILSHIN